MELGRTRSLGRLLCEGRPGRLRRRRGNLPEIGVTLPAFAGFWSLAKKLISIHGTQATSDFSARSVALLMGRGSYIHSRCCKDEYARAITIGRRGTWLVMSFIDRASLLSKALGLLRERALGLSHSLRDCRGARVLDLLTHTLGRLAARCWRSREFYTGSCRYVSSFDLQDE